MSDLDRFEYFVHVAKAGSLSEAAQQLGMTKASLSKQIKKLESELAVDLFSRAAYRLSLSPFGEQLLEQCLRLKRTLDDTRMLCNRFHDQPKGMMHVQAFSYFAQTLIFPRLEAFQKRYPRLEVSISLEERMPHFEKDQCDLALGFSLPVPDQEDIIQCRMGSTRYVLCASKAYWLQHKKVNTIEDIEDHRIISHTSRGDKHLVFTKPHQISIQPSLCVNRVEAMIECACLGLGLVQLPLYMMQNYLDSGALVEVLPDIQKKDVSIYYYYPKYRYTQPKVRAFIDYFLKD